MAGRRGSDCDSGIFPSNGLSYARCVEELLPSREASLTLSIGVYMTTTLISLETTYFSGVSLTHGATGSRQLPHFMKLTPTTTQAIHALAQIPTPTGRIRLPLLLGITISVPLPTLDLDSHSIKCKCIRDRRGVVLPIPQSFLVLPITTTTHH